MSGKVNLAASWDLLCQGDVKGLARHQHRVVVASSNASRNLVFCHFYFRLRLLQHLSQICFLASQLRFRVSGGRFGVPDLIFIH